MESISNIVNFRVTLAFLILEESEIRIQPIAIETKLKKEEKKLQCKSYEKMCLSSFIIESWMNWLGMNENPLLNGSFFLYLLSLSSQLRNEQARGRMECVQRIPNVIDQFIISILERDCSDLRYIIDVYIYII